MPLPATDKLPPAKFRVVYASTDMSGRAAALAYDFTEASSLAERCRSVIRAKFVIEQKIGDGLWVRVTEPE